MCAPIGYVGVDAGGRVVAAGTLHPNRVVAVPGAAWIVEFGPGEELPEVGEHLTVDRLLSCREP